MPATNGFWLYITGKEETSYQEYATWTKDVKTRMGEMQANPILHLNIAAEQAEKY